MLSQVYYLVRSRADGRYLVAHLNTNVPRKVETPGYLLLFREHFDALSYLNIYPDLADRFAVESVSGSQLEGLLKRWGFTGIGIVQDPLLPKIEFLSHS